ncbi:MAG: hypothetical protein K6U12_06790 [Armatimonadetes bacterium]|nr:hypothetical protein [Armatimonadota bacterium]
MLRLLGVFAVLVAMHYGNAQTVAFETDYYTFEAIAQRLSVGGRKVVCAPALRQRMALLSLKPRDWDSMRVLLETGLDLRIRPDSKDRNRWYMERRTEIEEKRLVSLIAQRLHHQAPGEMPNWVEIFESLPPVTEADFTALVEHFQKNEDAWRSALESSDGSLADIVLRALEQIELPQVSPVLMEWAQAQAQLPPSAFIARFGKRFGTHFAHRESTLKAKFALLGIAQVWPYRHHVVLWTQALRALQSPTLIEQALRNGMAWRVASLPESLMPYAAQLTREKPLASPPTPLVELPQVALNFALELQTDTIRLVRTLYLISPEGIYRIVDDDGVFSVDADTESLLSLFKELDATFAKRYEQATQTHSALLREAPLNEPIACDEKWAWAPIQGGFYSLYSWIASFAIARNQEVIAEVYARRALIDERKLHALANLHGNRAMRPPIRLDILLRATAEGAWRVERTQGVWVWRNWLAFLDRQQDIPWGVVRQWVRGERTLGTLEQLKRAVSPAQIHWLHAVGDVFIDGFFPLPNQPLRRPTFEILGEQLLSVELVRALPPDLRNFKDSRIRIPASQVPYGALRNWLRQSFNARTIHKYLPLRELALACLWLGRQEFFLEWVIRYGVVEIQNTAEWGALAVVMELRFEGE